MTIEIIANFVDSVWWKVLTSLITTASMAAAVTPNKWDNAALQFLRDILDAVALNFGNAKNEKKPEKKSG